MDVSHYSAAQVDRCRHILQGILHQNYVRRLDGNIRTGADRDADIRAGQGRRIIDPIAHHGTNLDSYELLVDGRRVDTPPKELELLYHLAASPNRVFTRNQLLDEVWGFDYFGDSRTVDVHIKRLREKLEGVSDQWSLKTVWGVGYKFEVVSPQ